MEPENLVQSVDKSQIPPLHHKRILAFVNHFLVSSCTFLNDFAANCESKFIELERKLQKVEAALTIVEAKLDSIPTDQDNSTAPISTETKTPTATPREAYSHNTVAPLGEEATNADSSPPAEEPAPVAGVKACEDVRYKKFFKMLHVGVPPAAVKIKMQAEGLDAALLDTPNLVLPDGDSGC